MRLITRAFIALTLLSIVGCHRKPPVIATTTPAPVVLPPPPAPPTTEAATRKFALGDYPGAALDFEEYLKLVPVGGQRDQALFYLGLIHALPPEGSQNWGQAGNYFNQLMAEFPESQLRPVAQLILSLRSQTTTLSADVARLTNEATQLRNEAEQLRYNSQGLQDRVASLEKTAGELTQEAAKREEKIRQLNADLERLIKIDLEPRPRR